LRAVLARKTFSLEGKMIRLANTDDAGRIAEINTTSWRYAYRDFVSEEDLYIKLKIEERIQTIRKWINEKENYVYVFEDDNNKVVKGMMGIDRCFDDDKKNAFEMHFLYIDPAFARNGIGGKMIDYFEEKGKQQSIKEYVIWVLEDNIIGRNFYEKNGYRSDNAKKIFQRIMKTEVRYIKTLA
jgi:ribosomal protein S18 acetylase RimI-like enzyme